MPRAGVRSRRGRRQGRTAATRSKTRPIELRAVRSNHRKRRPPNPSGRRQRPEYTLHIAPTFAAVHGYCQRLTRPWRSQTGRYELRVGVHRRAWFRVAVARCPRHCGTRLVRQAQSRRGGRSRPIAALRRMTAWGSDRRSARADEIVDVVELAAPETSAEEVVTTTLPALNDLGVAPVLTFIPRERPRSPICKTRW